MIRSGTMSKFVNLNKRSVSLPPGCKDLVDVLQPKRECSESFAVDFAGKPPKSIVQVTARLTSLEEQISGLFSTSATLETLTIVTSGAIDFVSLARLPDHAVIACSRVSESGNEPAIKSIFESHGAAPYPSPKYAEVGLESGSILSYTTPHMVRETATLIEALLRAVNDTTDETDLLFIRFTNEASS